MICASVQRTGRQYSTNNARMERCFTYATNLFSQKMGGKTRRRLNFWRRKRRHLSQRGVRIRHRPRSSRAQFRGFRGALQVGRMPRTNSGRAGARRWARRPPVFRIISETKGTDHWRRPHKTTIPSAPCSRVEVPIRRRWQNRDWRALRSTNFRASAPERFARPVTDARARNGKIKPVAPAATRAAGVPSRWGSSNEKDNRVRCARSSRQNSPAFSGARSVTSIPSPPRAPHRRRTLSNILQRGCNN